MPAKQSQEMRNALALVASGVSVTQAAAQSNITRVAVQVALKKIRDKQNKVLDLVK